RRVAILFRVALAAREIEALALGEHPVANLEDLRVRVIALDRDSDQIRGAERATGHLLPLHHAGHGVQPVAEEVGPLDVLSRRGLLHLLLEVAGDLLVTAGQKADDTVDVAPVLVLVDVADAGRLAALDVVVEAGDARAPPGFGTFAGPVLEELAEQVE